MNVTTDTSHATAGGRPLMATMTRRSATTALRVTTATGYVDVEVGPGYSARWSKKDADATREVTVSTARDCCAFVTSDLVVRGRRLERKLIAAYVTKTIREDSLIVDDAAVRRSTRWRYPEGQEAVAVYSTLGRELQLFEFGELVKTVITTGREVPSGWEGSNRLEGATIDGSEATEFTKKMPDAGEFTVRISPTGLGRFDYAVRFKRDDGAFFEGARGVGRDRRTYDEDRERTVFTKFDPVTGEMTISKQVVETTAAGTNIVTTNNWSRIDATAPYGLKQESASGLVTTKDDGFSSYTEATDGETEQRSSYLNDGQGNESESTVTNNADGSFTIEVRSKDKDGNTSGSAQTYDKDGNPVPPGDDGGTGGDDTGGGDTGDGDTEGDNTGSEKGLPAGDGSGSPSPNTIDAGAGAGELPAEDGSDPSPRPNSSGPGGGVLNQWLAADSPFFGGRVTGPSSRQASPVNGILRAMDDGGDGDGTGRRSNDDALIFDLGALLRRERRPENDPRVLFEALAQLTGTPMSSDGMRAANRLMDYVAG